MYDSMGHYEKAAPDCEHNPRLIEYCFDPSKAVNGVTLTATLLGINVPYNREVRTMSRKIQ